MKYSSPGESQGILGLSLRICVGDVLGRQRQVGSLAGAAHLLNDNTGVLR